MIGEYAMEDNEVETVDAEENEAQSDRISDLVASAVTGDYVNADKMFDAELNDRLNDVLDQARVRISGQIFNKEPVDLSDEEIDDIEISDEDIEAELVDVSDDEN